MNNQYIYTLFEVMVHILNNYSTVILIDDIIFKTLRKPHYKVACNLFVFAESVTHHYSLITPFLYALHMKEMESLSFTPIQTFVNNPKD